MKTLGKSILTPIPARKHSETQKKLIDISFKILARVLGFGVLLAIYTFMVLGTLGRL